MSTGTHPIETHADFKLVESLGYRMSRATTRCTQHPRQTIARAMATIPTFCWRWLKANSRTRVRRRVVVFTWNEPKEKPDFKFGEALVDMMQLGNIAAWNGIKAVSAWFLEPILIELLSRVAEDNVMSECFPRKSRLDTLMNTIVKRIVFNPLFKQPVARILKQHENWTIRESRLTQRYDDTGRLTRKE